VGGRGEVGGGVGEKRGGGGGRWVVLTGVCYTESTMVTDVQMHDGRLNFACLYFSFSYVWSIPDSDNSAG
jgi:hypothetical protein